MLESESMPNDERIPDWAIGLLRRPWLVFLLAALAVVGIPSLVVLYLDHRNEVRHRETLRADRPAGEPTGATPGTRPRVVLRGARVYVSIYSHVFVGEGERLPLAGTLSIRNTDDDHPLTITAVDYYDTRGDHVRNFLEEPLELRAHGSHDFLIAESDETGGAGANFVVEWVADKPVVAPVIEAVMVGRDRNGITTFARSGVVVERLGTE